ncbi:LysR family transcriptional regulator [Alicyclobacillus tolerans]|uniref:LysR family transcriptional regulator n=1 Tax=Alicyclobacillus tolerans TaxID=90970 RepID=UPI001F16C19C|nr:LysR family transcriptional regulator [Alicyclobacillus tolerans]MCF8567215.1 LysR family transcriptional regulator [Alicyclobacillus tolerans]
MNDLYRTLVEIVEEETLVRAAESLHLTQPTITRQVQQLERQLGMKLFERVGKRMIINRAGELTYRYAKSFLALEQKMLDELRTLSDPETGTIYVGAGLTPSIYLLPPLLADYRAKHPGVQFQVRSGSSREVWTLLKQREIDIGVVTTVDGKWIDEVDTVPLFEDDVLLVASPEHPLSQAGAVYFGELANYSFVLMREGSGLRQMIVRLAGERGVPIPIAMETDSLESINRLVQNGVGLSFLPRSAVQDDLTERRLVQIAVVDAVLGVRTITLIALRESQLSASAAQFVRELRGIQRIHRNSESVEP